MKTAMLLAAVLPIAAAQAQPDIPYRALGTEPFWALTIDHGVIRYDDAERRRLVVSAPVARPSFNGLRYVTPQLTVDVTRSRCSDGMSERLYPDSVTVTIGRRTLRGCGGVPIAAPTAASPIEGRWRIERIDGRPAGGQREAFLAFDGDRLHGNAGCNGFGGSYRFDRGFLTVGPLIATRMACPGGAMAQESAVMAALRERLSVSRNPAGKLVLTGRSGARLVLVR